MIRDSLHYLAAPYSGTTQIIVEQRMKLFCEVDAALIRLEIKTCSPLLKHFVLLDNKIPGDWKFWEEYSKNMLARTDSMIVIMMDGWEDSLGVTGEIAFAESNDIKIFYLDPYEWSSLPRLQRDIKEFLVRPEVLSLNG